MRVIDLDAVVLVRFFSIAFLLLTFLLVAERMVLLFLTLLSQKWLFGAWLLLALAADCLSKFWGVGDSDWTFVFFAAIREFLGIVRTQVEYGMMVRTVNWLALCF